MKFIATMLVILLLLPVSGSAHHSILPFDKNRFEELNGVVSEVRWMIVCLLNRPG